MMPDEREKAICTAVFLLGWRSMWIDTYLAEPDVGLVLCHLSEIRRRALIALANDGSASAHHSLCRMAVFLTGIGDPLPPWLQAYVVSAAQRGLSKNSERARRPMVNFLRNVTIGQTVGMVVEWCNLRPRRRAGAHSESACSIVAAALARLGLHMSEANVASIWQSVRDDDMLLHGDAKAKQKAPVLDTSLTV
jgi:hypothetical protein